MKLTTLRYLDRKVGVPISFLESIIKRVFRKQRKIEDLRNSSPHKILLIKLWGLGSVVLLSPIVTNLRRKYPQAEIHFLTKKGVDIIYKQNTFDKIFTLNTGGIANAIKDFVLTPIRLKRERYDIIIDFEIVSYYTAMLTFMLWARFNIGYQIIGKTKDRLYDFNCIYHESKHITEIFCSPLKLLGMKDGEIDYDLIEPYVSEADEKAIFQKFESLGECIAVNVNSSDLALERRWTIEGYRELIDFLTGEGKTVLLIGSPDEADYVSTVHSGLKDKTLAQNIAGKISLTQTFALLKHVKLFVTNDSGPLHIAIAYRTPTISFFGPETPAIYGPLYRKELHKAYFLNLFCSPCISVFRDKNFVCRNENRCMKEIHATEVIEYIKSNNLL